MTEDGAIVTRVRNAANSIFTLVNGRERTSPEDDEIAFTTEEVARIVLYCKVIEDACETLDSKA